jgi:hypothetical protein
MPAKFSTFRTIFGNCEQCSAMWWYEGWDNGRWYKAYISGTKPKLCKRCLDAKKWGEYRYPCRGCGVKMRGQLQELGELFKMSFCQACMTSYYGRYDPENPTLIHVLVARSVKKKMRRRYYVSEELERLARAEERYGNRVRRLSHANLRRYPEVLNPNGHKLGGSGTAGGYHLDHIISISTCWEYKVPEVNASDVRNLQVIPWLVNLSRGSGMGLEQLVGWPYPRKRKRAGID